MSSLDELIIRVPPPINRVGERSDLGSEQAGQWLPDDVSALVQTYGAGSFDDFLWLLQPSSVNPNLDITYQTVQARDALEVLAETETLEFLSRHNVPVGDLVVWAVSDNGDICYWYARDHGETYAVLVNEARGPAWFHYEGSVTTFLHRLLIREIACPIFPDDFPSGNVVFAQHE
jgi:hypothetical protein